MTALKRAEEDVERGDHRLAIQGLESYLVAKGYRPEVQKRLGQIAHKMHDGYRAGRWWLTSTATGEEVEQAIAIFMSHAGGDVQDALKQVPASARLSSISDYPEIVQERLQRFGLYEHLADKGWPPGPRKASAWTAWLQIAIACAVLFFVVASCSVGAVQIFRWILRGN